MVIDTSALVAQIFGEPGAVGIDEAIAQDPVRLISAGTLLETAVVVEARVGEAGGLDLDRLLHKAQVEIVPFSDKHAEVARVAYRTYGKGHHPAGLNFGDCISYALAKATGEPLLFKGDDFAQTDISRVKVAVHQHDL